MQYVQYASGHILQHARNMRIRNPLHRGYMRRRVTYHGAMFYEVLVPSRMHSACNSKHFVRAAAGEHKRKSTPFVTQAYIFSERD